MCIVHVSSKAEPLLCLVVSLDATCKALVVRVIGDTLVVQVVGTCIECATVCCTAYAEVVLLTQTIVIDLVFPVVGSDIVLLAVSTYYDSTQGSVGVQLAVHTNQVLTLGLSVNIVTQTELSALNQVLVSPLPSSNLVKALTVGSTCNGGSHSVVLKLLIVSLIVSSRVGDAVVVLTALHIRTPLGIECDLCVLTLLGSLGSHHDNTVTTTSTIERRRSSVLLDNNALNVLRVDVVQ